MPSAREARKHGGVVRVRTKKLSGGRYVRIYFFRDGTTWAEVRKKHGKAQ